jgi:hypothetical protein
VTIALVLDSSAMVAYARGNVAVGELLILADEEDSRVGLPGVALAQAFASTLDADHNMLRILIGNAGTVVLPLDDEVAERVGRFAHRTDLWTAHAVISATDAWANLVTAEPGKVAGLADEGMIIEI